MKEEGDSVPFFFEPYEGKEGEIRTVSDRQNKLFYVVEGDGAYQKLKAAYEFTPLPKFYVDDILYGTSSLAIFHRQNPGLSALVGNLMVLVSPKYMKTFLEGNSGELLAPSNWKDTGLPLRFTAWWVSDENLPLVKNWLPPECVYDNFLNAELEVEQLKDGHLYEHFQEKEKSTGSEFGLGVNVSDEYCLHNSNQEKNRNWVSGVSSSLMPKQIRKDGITANFVFTFKDLRREHLPTLRGIGRWAREILAKKVLKVSPDSIKLFFHYPNGSMYSILHLHITYNFEEREFRKTRSMELNNVIESLDTTGEPPILSEYVLEENEDPCLNLIKTFIQNPDISPLHASWSTRNDSGMIPSMIVYGFDRRKEEEREISFLGALLNGDEYEVVDFIFKSNFSYGWKLKHKISGQYFFGKTPLDAETFEQNKENRIKRGERPWLSLGVSWESEIFFLKNNMDILEKTDSVCKLIYAGAMRLYVPNTSYQGEILVIITELAELGNLQEIYPCLLSQFVFGSSSSSPSPSPSLNQNSKIINNKNDLSSIATTSTTTTTIENKLLLENTFKEKNLNIEESIRKIFWEICSIIAKLHDEGICHRDIKLENFVVTKDGKIKLIDFALAKYVSDIKETENTDEETEDGLLPRTTTIVGSYRSPELHSHICEFNNPFAVYNPFLLDSWALGMVLLTLIHLAGKFAEELKDGRDIESFLRNNRNGKRNKEDLDKDIGDIRRIEKFGLTEDDPIFLKWDHTSLSLTLEVKDILCKLLHPKPDLRLSVEQCLVNPWMLREIKDTEDRQTQNIEEKYIVKDNNKSNTTIFFNANSSNVKIIAILGPPGVGKTTVLSRLKKEYSFLHFSVGSILRYVKDKAKNKDVIPALNNLSTSSHVDEENDLLNRFLSYEGRIGETILSFEQRHEWDLKDKVSIVLLSRIIKAIKAQYKKKKQLIVLDNFPKSITTLQLLQEKINCTLDYILFFDIADRQVLRDRMTSRAGRNTDPHNIEKRINLYYSELVPPLEKMLNWIGESKSHRITLPSDTTEEETYQTIKSKLLNYLQDVNCRVKGSSEMLVESSLLTSPLWDSPVSSPVSLKKTSLTRSHFSSDV